MNDFMPLSRSKSEQMIVISLCGNKVVFMRNRVDTVNAFEDKNIGFVKVCEVSDTVSLADMFEGPHSKNCMCTVMCMKNN